MLTISYVQFMTYDPKHIPDQLSTIGPNIGEYRLSGLILVSPAKLLSDFMKIHYGLKFYNACCYNC